MTTDAHRRLAERINRPPSPLKNLASDVFFEILDILFTEEEAAVVSEMPRLPVTAGKMAARLERPAGEIGPILERLAERAVIFSYGEGDAKKYFVFPIFPGVYEMQFWKRPDDEETRRLARLYDELYDREFAENLMKRPSRVFRIMPSEGSLPVEKTGVLPSDSLREVIERHDAWSLANCCACRRQRSLLGDGCDKPRDVCMQFGHAARYIEKKGFGRMVSRAEILDALDRAEDAGLIHFVDNVELPVIACNCCACCCVSLANLTRFNTPAMFTESRFIPERTARECAACGACTRYCISGALHLYDRKLIFERWRCIGCGVCVSKCGHAALRLVPRPDSLPVPENYGQMLVDVGNEWTGANSPGGGRALRVNRAVGNLMQKLMRRLS